LKPPAGVRVSVEEADWPAAAVNEAGFAVNVKSAAAAPRTITVAVAVAAVNWLLEAKEALSVLKPACVGVSEQLAKPFASVVAVQVALPNVKVTL